jgi:hypothetical protein
MKFNFFTVNHCVLSYKQFTVMQIILELMTVIEFWRSLIIRLVVALMVSAGR